MNVPYVPAEFQKLDPQLLKRLTEQASTIIGALIARGSAPRPTFGERAYHVRFPRGTAEFVTLHGFVSDINAFTALLNYALAHARQTEWKFSPADRALTPYWNDESFAVMLHPAPMDVTALAEVPDSVRIFSIERRQPYGIREWPAASPVRIALARTEATASERRKDERWHAIKQRAQELLERLRAERDRQRRTLDAEVAGEIDDLLHKALQYPQSHFYDLLTVAFYLGVFDEVTAGFNKTV